MQLLQGYKEVPLLLQRRSIVVTECKMVHCSIVLQNMLKSAYYEYMILDIYSKIIYSIFKIKTFLNESHTAISFGIVILF